MSGLGCRGPVVGGRLSGDGCRGRLSGAGCRGPVVGPGCRRCGICAEIDRFTRPCDSGPSTKWNLPYMYIFKNQLLELIVPGPLRVIATSGPCKVLLRVPNAYPRHRFRTKHKFVSTQSISWPGPLIFDISRSIFSYFRDCNAIIFNCSLMLYIILQVGMTPSCNCAY